MSELSLYNIKEEYKELTTKMEEEIFTQGGISEETQEALVINQEQLVEKVQGYGHIMSTLDARVGMAERELARIEAFKKRQENVKKQLQYNLMQALLTYGEEGKDGVFRLEVGTTTLSTRRSKFVDVQDESKIPDEFQNVTLKLPKDVHENILNTLRTMDLDGISAILLANTGRDDIKIEFSPNKAAIKTEGGVEGAPVEEKLHLTVK